MRLLQRMGTWILAGGVAAALAPGAVAQNGQQQSNGNNGSSPTTNSNTPYVPPTVPSGDASTGIGRGTGGTGYGTGQAGGSGSAMGRLSTSLGDDLPQDQQQMQMQQARARNSERQKQLVADTQKLVDLANQLQADVSKSSKDMLSLEVVRKADEIDKLARSVRDKMKNAN